MSIQRCSPWIAFSALVAAASCNPDTQLTPPNDITKSCTSSDQCAKGEVCSAGVCIIGECMVREDCPHPLDQLCNELNKCIPDPASPIGNECPGGTRDCEMGEFCSAGTCYSVANAKVCRRQSDCSGGQRCDPINGFCVDDRGGCNRANEYPELACAEGDLCDAVTGHCSSPSGPTCTPATEVEDCGEYLRCIGSRCVQCTANENCGVDDNICCEGTGTQCNLATGRCVSAFLCSTDEDCTGCSTRPGLGETRFCSDHSECTDDGDCSSMSSRRCATSSGECIQPDCTSDDDCSGTLVCDLTTYQCYRPPPSCNETNEPNNAASSATPVTTTSYSDVLCRGDADYLKIVGHANTRLRVTVGISSAAYGITAALLDSSSATVATASFSSTTQQVVLATYVPAQSDFYVNLTASTTLANDSYNYTVTIQETAPLACDTEPGEPNDSIALTGGSVLEVGTPLTRALCGTSDQDFFAYLAPANLRSIITATFTDDDGDIELQLLTAAGTVIDSATGSADTETVLYTAQEATQLYLRVYRPNSTSNAESQSYTLNVRTETPPPCVDPEEPNGSIAEASDSILHAGPPITRMLCGEDDDDFFRIDAPGGQRTTVTVTYQGDDDPYLYLYDDAGDSITYDYGGSGIAEVSYVTQVDAVIYAKVYYWAYESEELSYSIGFTTEALPPCVDAFEPNEAQAAAKPISPGHYSATICNGSDKDFYSITLPRAGNLDVTINFLDAEGDLSLTLLKPDGSQLDYSDGFGNTENVNGANLAAGTYYIVAKPYTTGLDITAQAYTMDVVAPNFCSDDEYEGTGNNTMNSAYPLRDEAFNSFSINTDLKLCGSDDDWYRLLLLGDEFFAAEITGPTGISVELYRQEAAGGVLVAGGRETAVAAGRSTIYLGYPVPGRGAIYYLQVSGGGTAERTYTFNVSAQTDTCNEDAAESNDVPQLATPVAPPQLVQSSVLCPLRDVDVYRVNAVPGRSVHAAVAFNADNGDIDVVATLNGAEVDSARTVNGSGASTETIDYSATGCGELYISVLRHDGETAVSIPYTATIDVTGGVEVDGGSCGGTDGGGAGG